MSVETLFDFIKTVDGGITIIVLLYVGRQIREDVQVILNRQWALIEKLTNDDDEL